SAGGCVSPLDDGRRASRRLLVLRAQDGAVAPRAGTRRARRSGARGSVRELSGGDRRGPRAQDPPGGAAAADRTRSDLRWRRRQLGAARRDARCRRRGRVPGVRPADRALHRQRGDDRGRRLSPARSRRARRARSRCRTERTACPERLVGGGNGANGNGANGNGADGNGHAHARTAEAIGPFPDARVLLDRYGLRAKKSFGQNFLVSERALRAIADATVTSDDDWIVEIGAGLGTLTARIVERVTAGKVIALEPDPDMVRVLKAELGHVDNLEIEQVDALRY